MFAELDIADDIHDLGEAGIKEVLIVNIDDVAKDHKADAIVHVLALQVVHKCLHIGPHGSDLVSHAACHIQHEHDIGGAGGLAVIRSYDAEEIRLSAGIFPHAEIGLSESGDRTIRRAHRGGQVDRRQV